MGRAVCGIYEALWLARLHQASVGALYMHIPFCAHKCAYCDFTSWTTRRDDSCREYYVAALKRQLDQIASVGLLAACSTAYVGGGTPSLLGAHLADLVRHLYVVAPKIGELTCEANPDSLTPHLLAQLAEAGCTRLSIGVQSLDDGELALLGRLHTAQQAKDCLRAAVQSGLSVSCDLMCALPEQTARSWQRTLDEVVACGVQHVSVYPLQIEEGTPFDERYGEADTSWNDSEVQAERMEQAASTLNQAGFARYEVASYAREGRQCQHNKAYWSAVPYLGLGCGASSMLTREGYELLRTVAPQLPGVSEGVRRVRLTCTSSYEQIVAARGVGELHFNGELLGEAQAAAEDLMLGMRMSEGVDPGLLEHARNALGLQRVDGAFEACAAKELVRPEGRRWAPTKAGWLLGNELYGALWDLSQDGVETFTA